MINTKNILTVDDATTISDNDTLFVGQNSQLKQIDYDLLADAILNKISSKSYSELDTTAKTLIGALDELNRKSIFLIDYNSIDNYREGAHFIYGELIKDRGYLFGLEYQYTDASSLKYGAQFIISWIEGIMFRKLNSSNWSEWDTLHT